MSVNNNHLTSCFCGSNKIYNDCCKKYVEETSFPETAEQLMRSRYCGYVLKKYHYLFNTWNAKDRPSLSTIQSDDGCKWIDLEIVDTKLGNKTERNGTVTFIARYLIDSTLYCLTEKSNFIYSDNKWLYTDGQPDTTSKTISKNSKCPCGSMKKFKRCCFE